MIDSGRVIETDTATELSTQSSHLWFTQNTKNAPFSWLQNDLGMLSTSGNGPEFLSIFNSAAVIPTGCWHSHSIITAYTAVRYLLTKNTSKCRESWHLTISRWNYTKLWTPKGGKNICLWGTLHPQTALPPPPWLSQTHRLLQDMLSSWQKQHTWIFSWCLLSELSFFTGWSVFSTCFKAVLLCLFYWGEYSCGDGRVPGRKGCETALQSC